MKSKLKVVVVGGGAGGMMAAGKAAQNGASVLLIEKNKRLGKKILISGKGRCNLTNTANIEEIINNFPGNGKFLYSALTNFSNLDLMAFFKERGVELKIERGGRVFPNSDSSGEIVKALENYLAEQRVQILRGVSVVDIKTNGEKVEGVILADSREILGDRVIIATGGASFPGTGSTGDGYNLAQRLGHSIVPIRPSLIPLEVKEEWAKDLQGLSLKNVTVILQTTTGKKLAQAFGEMLFTHFGVSGPIILTISRKAVDYWQKNYLPLILKIDLKPALNKEKLDQRLQRDIVKFSNKQIKNGLGDLLPQRLIMPVINLAGINVDKVMHQITKEERRKIIDVLKGLQVTLIGSRPLNEAIVTAGGVNVKEVNPQTMESKLIKGLYFAGEVLDIDGLTGGYNLQAAFSTGYTAGNFASMLN
ncbi:MAG: NAD(P)/FAD-dependent oxidoreductase [Clostridia bacterium]|nr:NAD(P)/FAD-dependent oxidoreductase [Clostridia bacterium]